MGHAFILCAPSSGVMGIFGFCSKQQGTVTEFVESLPTKTSTFAGDALDVLMCTCCDYL